MNSILSYLLGDEADVIDDGEDEEEIERANDEEYEIDNDVLCTICK